MGGRVGSVSLYDSTGGKKGEEGREEEESGHGGDDEGYSCLYIDYVFEGGGWSCEVVEGSEDEGRFSDRGRTGAAGGGGGAEGWGLSAVVDIRGTSGWLTGVRESNTVGE